jgi:uncharacterized membrane-anchored protein YitT (DUF2179 family)
VKRSWARHAFDLLLIAAGATLMALSYNLFLLPHRVVPGGAGAVAMVLNHLLDLPVGGTIVAINVPLFLIAVRVLGRSYGAKSLLGMLLSAALIDFFTYALPLEPGTSNPILACVFGGILLGGGLGLVFRGGGSTGGSDIAGQILSRYTSLSTGAAILLVDTVVISFAAAGFGTLEAALYGYLNLYISTRVIDVVLEGMSYTRAVWIVSDDANPIAEAILLDLGRGATMLHATGAFTDERKDVIFAVMSKREVLRVREIARSIDPKAFVMITDVYEVLGEGFRPRQPT